MADSKCSGVYCIRNTVNGKRYVGSTTKLIQSRWRRHRRELQRGVHGNRYLQSAWNKYGANVFEWLVLANCDPDACIAEEQRWIDMFGAAQRANGYNILPVAGSQLGMKHTAESRKKMSDYRRSRKVLPAELDHLRELAASQRGVPISEDHKAKISESLTGRVFSESHRAKLSESATGRVLSAEHKDKLRQSGIGRKKSPETVAKFRASVQGQTRSAEQREKIRQSLLGKQHTPERRENQRKARMAYLERTRNQPP